jgi:four helix bundle protein
MFDFENLAVYLKAKKLSLDVLNFLKLNNTIDLFLKNQLKRAVLSIVINIAEGSGRHTKADKRNFYVISRGSTYECVSILDLIFGANNISQLEFQSYYSRFEEISKMLFGLINSQK